MDTFNLITPLEGNLKAAVQLRPVPRREHEWVLDINLFYDGNAAGTTSFNLYGYSRADAEQVARSIRDNEYLMKEIDDFLWGESD